MHSWHQLRTAFAAARPLDAIYILSGSGYVGSVFRKTIPDAGEWYSNGVATGVTTQDLTITLALEGTAIDFRTPGGFVSNVIHLFMPTDLDAMRVWLDAYDPSMVTFGTGAGMSSLASRAGLFTFNQATAALQPIYSATGRNGKPAFVFTGGQFMSTANFGLLPDNDESGTSVALAYANSLSANYRAIVGWGSGNTTGNYRIIGKANTNNRPLVLAEVETRDETKAFFNTDELLIGIYVPTRQDIIVDGGAINSTAVTLNTGANTYGNLGKGRNDDPRQWEGSIHELIVYGGEKITADRQKLEGYECHRWGYTSLLPPGHPYKNAAPRA